jgi:hypothetical protein
VRPAYIQLYNKIKKQVNKLAAAGKLNQYNESATTVITGNSGVGKSAFLAYMFHKLIEERKQVIYHTKRKGLDEIDAQYRVIAVTHDSNGAPIVRHSNTIDIFAHLLYDGTGNTYYLMDTCDTRNVAVIREHCPMIIVASPDVESSLAGFSKLSGTIILVMPTWSVHELKACHQQCYPNSPDVDPWGGLHKFVRVHDAAIVESYRIRPNGPIQFDTAADDSISARVNLVGGIPRYVFRKTSADVDKLFDMLCANVRICKLDQLIEMIRYNVMIGGNKYEESVNHSLVKMNSNVDENFQLSSVDFISNAIATKVSKRLEQQKYSYRY